VRFSESPQGLGIDDQDDQKRYKDRNSPEKRIPEKEWHLSLGGVRIFSFAIKGY
jgi:hypothetical protein